MESIPSQSLVALMSSGPLSKKWISDPIVFLIHRHWMWGQLHRRKWYPLIPSLPRGIPKIVWLHLPHYSAKRNTRQHIHTWHGHVLPKVQRLVRFHRIQGRRLGELPTDGEILWRWRQHPSPCIHDDHRKLLESEVRVHRENFFRPYLWKYSLAVFLGN